MWLEVVLFALILILFAYLDAKKPKNFPPGPKWLPILGSMVAVSQERKRSNYFYKITSNMSEGRGLVGLRLGKDLIVVVVGAQALKEFLMSEDLAGRPMGEFYQLRTWGERHGVLLTDSTVWKEQRRFILRHLREFGFGKGDMSRMIEAETAIMVDSIKELLKDGKVELDMSKIFSVHVLNTLWTMLAGIRYNAEDKELKKLQSLLSELFDNSHMVGALFHHFPILRFLAPEFSGYNLYVKVHQPLWNFLYTELKRHKETFDPKETRDFMDVYLQMLNCPDRPESYSEKQLVAICMDMFMAGSETTSKTLQFTFLYMLLYPEVQKKAQEEIDRVLGDRSPSLNDRPNMPYMEAVCLESIRMFMGRAHGVPHRALRDTTLNGYFIPKDTMVVANFYDVFFGRDFQGSDPEVFRPERYLKNGVPSVPDTYIPFGFGKRRCMGESLARANVFLFTSMLLQNFSFSIAEGSPPVEEWIDGVTPGPKPYKAVVTLRH